MSRKGLYIVALCLLLSCMATAATRSTQYRSSGVTHWVGLSLTGVEANMLPSGERIKVKAGGGAGGHLMYELRKGGFFFNVGVGADFIVTNTMLEAYEDAFVRMDHTRDVLTYRYLYSDYAEQQRQVRVIVPVQFGYQFGDYVYAGIGASLRTVPLLNIIGTRTRMYTQGEYERFIEPFRDVPLYGFWPEEKYVGIGQVRTATNEVAVEAEVGVNIPLNVKRLRLRAGLYAGYDIPLSKLPEASERVALVDYSAVNLNPATQSLENLKQNIRFNSMLDTALAGDRVHRVRVGARVTLLFDVTLKRKDCMCWKK